MASQSRFIIFAATATATATATTLGMGGAACAQSFDLDAGVASQYVGKGLGKTTGWVHRQTLKDSGVDFVKGVVYERIDDDGLHVRVHDGEKDTEGTPRVLDVDTIVLCTGQESVRDLVEPLEAAGVTTHVIGGADVAAELDAKRAIDQGSRLAARL